MGDGAERRGKNSKRRECSWRTMGFLADGVGESVVSVGRGVARRGAGEAIGAEVGPKESVIARSPMMTERTGYVRRKLMRT